MRFPTLKRSLVVTAAAFGLVLAAPLPAQFRDAYAKVAPHPEQWPTLVGKVMKLGLDFKRW
jgi:hypothetical protein